MAELQLSRLLYPRDEAEIAFVSALLGGTFDEVIYWAAELHSSGWNPFPVIWRTYYTFYASVNPTLANYIQRKERKYYSHKDEFALLAVLKNLQLSKWHLDCFFLKQLMYQNKPPQHVFRGKMPAWLQSLHDAGSCLPLCRVAQSICKGSWLDIISYIQAAERQNVDILSLYTMVVTALQKKTKVNCSVNWFQLHENDVSYNWDILLAILIYGFLPSEERLGTNMYVAVTQNEKQSWKEYCISLDEDKCVLQRYDIMPERVKYWIPGEIIQEFFVSRMGVPQMEHRNIWALYPESYLSNTPYWKERMEQCRGVINSKRELVFDTDENNELFYDMYWIHPDEQSPELYNACMPQINNHADASYVNSSALWLSFITQSPRLKEGVINYQDGVSWLGQSQIRL
jgi:hypothetical protein